MNAVCKDEDDDEKQLVFLLLCRYEISVVCLFCGKIV